ncbi:MAG TPA: DNA-processing protein DprA [Gemmataceae bacterium]|nr:DNA-processing protein DprA [Gemmataceae bacterium]
MSIPLTPEVRALLVLHLVPGLGPMRTAALLERFGSAEAVLRAGREELLAVDHVGPKLTADLLATVRQADIDAELRLLERHNTRLLVLGTPDYPPPLATITDAPHLLYVRGTLEPRDGRAVGIVGSRHCTAYGKRMAEHLAAGLARAGYTIVSGLARGIDGVAHRAALQAGGRTVAVLAGGLSRIYPPEHAGLAKEVEAAGALLTESTMAQAPLAPLFPARNRLISGLCQGVVIVEAAERSGALITASHAAEQGRAAMAVPGPADSPTSGGTNELIRKGAVLVRGPEDVREELEGVSATVAPPPSAEPPPGLDEAQRRVWELLREQPRHLDEIVQRLGLQVPQVAGMLLTLELKKVVRRLPGNRYERC